MPDYKEMYLKMLRTSEQAVNILITAQRECEDRYISSPETVCKVVSILPENKKGIDEK